VNPLPIIERAFPLDDIAIRAGGTGRTVVAYAAMFDAPYEVRDGEGHYFERIHQRAYDSYLATGNLPVCLFNHGFMLGTRTPSEQNQALLGTPLEVRADAKGLLTVTEYLNTPHADYVLEAIRGGAVTSQSFRGPILQSRAAGRRDGLRVTERMRLGIIDYGPSPFAVNREAAILSVRSQALLDELDDLTDEERAELLAKLSDASTEPTTVVPPESPSPIDAPLEPTVEVPPTGPSLEAIQAEQAQRRRRAELTETEKS
jgi:phage head maturation protease